MTAEHHHDPRYRIDEHQVVGDLALCFGPQAMPSIRPAATNAPTGTLNFIAVSFLCLVRNCQFASEPVLENG